MRNWNSAAGIDLPSQRRFLSYLWGIETPVWWNRWPPFCCFYRTYEELKPTWQISSETTQMLFLSYLWGIETSWSPQGNLKAAGFLSYLWGIETQSQLLLSRRDQRFYRTYEELKHNLSFFCPGGTNVFIVPMRNWNIYSPLPKNRGWTFLSYLWGIETLTPEILRTCNHPFLSYLWGIETPFLRGMQAPEEPGFYRTYEELKLIHPGYKWFSFLVFIVPMRNWNINILLCTRRDYSVFIVPMRNWNAAELQWIDITIFVFIVPMRNWNPCNYSIFIPHFLVFIVPMRNWNIMDNPDPEQAVQSFYRTYEELKPMKPILQTMGTTFLSYLWGIETSYHFKPGYNHHKFLSYLWGIETPNLSKTSMQK